MRLRRTGNRYAASAFALLCARDTSKLVEEEFKECHSPERAKKLAAKPVSLPWELLQPDRRALDLAVFELLGVADAASLLARLRDRLTSLTEKAAQLAGSRTSDDARATDLAGLVRQWMLHGKPLPKAKKGKAAALAVEVETTED